MTNLKINELQKIAKERTVRTQDIEYDLETLVKKLENKVIKLDPEYQRKHRWNEETSSKLIESLILNIPIPLVYLSQDVDVDKEDEGIARYSVIDGQQRLTAIKTFMKNKLKLQGMQVLEDLNGYFYKDLPSFLIRRLEERTIKCLRIDSTIDSQVKYDIFERLNSGSVILGTQELRNAVYRGAFNDLIKDLAENENFRILNQIDINNPSKSKKVQKMEDVELVLRFFAFSNNRYKSMRKGLKNFLSKSMDEFNSLSPNQLEMLKNKFENTMRIIIEIFGERAFAKYKLVGNHYQEMSAFNISVYDALAIAVADEIDKGKKLNKKSAEEFKKLFKNEEFFNTISGSTNDKSKIEYRIDSAKKVI